MQHNVKNGLYSNNIHCVFFCFFSFLFSFLFLTEMKVKLSFILMMHLLLLVSFVSRKCIYKTKNKYGIEVTNSLLS